MLRYLASLPTSRIVLWCYLIGDLCLVYQVTSSASIVLAD